MPALLTVTGGRVELELSSSVVLGRGKDCDVVVADMSCSRKHAQIEVGALPELVSIVDLGSSNGTFVDDKRISGRKAIAHGSRIQIGATLYLLSTADPQREPDDELLDTGTIAVEKLSIGASVDEKVLKVVRKRNQRGTDLAGQLGAFSIVEVLQILIQTGRSGTLNVALADGHATVEVRKGEVLAATYQELEGFPALLMLARRDAGVFWLEEHSTPCPRTIHEPSSRLLVDLCCAMDENAVESES